MALNRWFGFIAIVIVSYLFLAQIFGITGGFVHVLIFSVGVAALFSILGFPLLPFNLNKNMMIGVFIVSFGILALSYGWLTGFMPTGAVSSSFPGTTTTTTNTAGCSVSPELLGKTSTLTLNAWDLVAATPYSSAVSFSTSCWLFKNGNSAANFVNTTTSTSGGVQSSFNVGDKLYVYCGGTTYYGDAVENYCIKSQSESVSINAYTIVSPSSTQVIAYDSTGATALNAGHTTGVFGNYNLTLGASGSDNVYVKFKVNAANKAYRFCGWAVSAYNISSVEPIHSAAKYTSVYAPKNMTNVLFNLNKTSGADKQVTAILSYNMWKTDKPILLKQWDSIKEGFVIKAGTNDPIGPNLPTAGQQGDNAAIIVAKDCAWSRGDNGMMYDDFYQHDTSENDVGMYERMENITTTPAQTGGVEISII